VLDIFKCIYIQVIRKLHVTLSKQYFLAWVKKLNKVLETILKETENEKETLFFMMQMHIIHVP